ncbi:hypothetical protein WA556_005077, partial [Blastocystis sp. ATCC 50177/Nand II]
MNPNTNYNIKYSTQMLEAAEEYVKTRSILPLLNYLNLSLNSNQTHVILNALRAKNLFFDSSLENTHYDVQPGFRLSCCVCNVMEFKQWKLIGAACDAASEVIKCIIPFLFCEKCFRKRFCIQSQTPILCGVAVLPSKEYYINRFQEIASEPAPNSLLLLTANTAPLSSKQPKRLLNPQHQPSLFKPNPFQPAQIQPSAHPPRPMASLALLHKEAQHPPPVRPVSSFPVPAHPVPTSASPLSPRLAPQSG